MKTIHTKTLTEPISPRSLKLRTGNEQAYIESILDSYPEVFRQEPGKIHEYECHIRLKNDIPVRVKPYPIPIAKIEAVENKSTE